MASHAKREKFLEMLQTAIHRADFSSSGMIPRLRRLLFYGFRYLENALAYRPDSWLSRFWPSRELKGKTFWDAELVLPNKDFHATSLCCFGLPASLAEE